MMTEEAATIRRIRWLFWLYLVLLVSEGALRKWVAPSLSNPLLIIRDPIALLIYLLALRAGLWPRNVFVTSIVILGFVSWFVAIFVLQRFLPLSRALMISGYGFRSDFFHLPLIFLFPKIFGQEEVRRVGWWALFLMIPMAILMAIQFESPPDSFINRTVGLGDAEQITAGGGKIRPPGTFSFISGAVFYVSGCAAFLLYGVITRGSYRSWLLYLSGLGVTLAVFVSGSRSLALSVALVIAALAFILLVRPSGVNRFGRILVLAVILGAVVLKVPIVREGMSVLSDRFSASAEAEDKTVTEGLIERTLSGFTESFIITRNAPLFGWGLGVGTNAAARSFGRPAFLLGENEWSRIIYESGPILGVAFILWRIALTAYLGFRSVQAIRQTELLPWLVFAAGFVAILNGQLGQPTILGFAVVLNGLCLAALTPNESREAPPKEIPKKQIMRGRSIYAEQLHGRAEQIE